MRALSIEDCYAKILTRSEHTYIHKRVRLQLRRGWIQRLKTCNITPSAHRDFRILPQGKRCGLVTAPLYIYPRILVHKHFIQCLANSRTNPPVRNGTILIRSFLNTPSSAYVQEKPSTKVSHTLISSKAVGPSFLNPCTKLRIFGYSVVIPWATDAVTLVTSCSIFE